MIFKRERQLNNKVFYTKTAFKSYGDTETSKEEERELFESLGHPEIDMGGQHSGYFTVEDGEIVLTEETEGAAFVSFVFNSNPVKVNGRFVQEFTVDAKSEEPVEPLTSAQVAEAKCILFEKSLDEKLAEAIEGMLEKKTTFEDDYPKDITIPSINGEEAQE